MFSPHHRAHAAFAHRRLELLPEIRFIQIALGRFCVEPVTFGFRTAVNGKVFCAGHRLDISRIVTLQSLDEGHGQPGRKKWVFTIRFLIPALAGSAAQY